MNTIKHSKNLSHHRFMSFSSVSSNEDLLPILKYGKYNNFYRFKNKFLKHIYAFYPELCSSFLTGISIDIENGKESISSMLNLFKYNKQGKELSNLIDEKKALYNMLYERLSEDSMYAVNFCEDWEEIETTSDPLLLWNAIVRTHDETGETNRARERARVKITQVEIESISVA